MINQIINGYKFIKRIGNGAFGAVYEETKDNMNYAIKVIDLSKFNKDENIYSKIKEEDKIVKE